MAPGTQVGTYRLLEKIGEGGMGTVWLAEHVMLGRRAAIKLLHPSYGAREEIVTRFFNEARAATAIADPGIVQIFDYGQHDDGSAYLVMELLEGETLHARLRRVGRLPIDDALRLSRQIASSLGAAHARGIIHRDLKPENLFLVHDPEVPGGERVKILDFGIAKLIGDPTQQTNTQAVLGTPMFMSPEQCRGAGQVDQRSDVYALGCVLFALITGRPPFVAAGPGEVIAMQLMTDPPRPSDLVSGVPLEVETLVMTCLAKAPGDRYDSARELASALGQLLGSPSLPSLTSGPRVIARGSYPAVPAASPTTLSVAVGATQPDRKPPHRRRRRRAWWLVGAVGACAAAGAIAIAVTTGGSRAPTVSPVATVPPPTPPVIPPTPPTPPAPTPAPPAPAPVDPLVAPMTELLGRFRTWSQTHKGAPCPTASELGAPVLDPWGTPLALTCSDQPGKQIAGAVSAGPDRTPNTDDDVGSWTLREVAATMYGARWPVAAKPSAPALRRPRPAVTPAAPTAPTFQVDENGIPTHRE